MHNTVGEDALMNFSQETSDFHDFCAVSKTKSSSPFLGTFFSLTFLWKGTHNKKSVFFFTFSMEERGGGAIRYIRMIGMIVVFFRGCNRRFSILWAVQAKSFKKIKLVFVMV